MTFDITIPVLNEEAELEPNVRRILSFIDSEDLSKHKFRIVIADNGSTDSTYAIADRLSKALPGRVASIRLEKRGVGLALKTSWTASEADIVGYMDLDLATDLSHLRDVVKAFESSECDILYGSRLHKHSKVIGRPLKREITSRVFNMLLKFYLGVSFSDGMCGFKFMKREVFPKLYAGGATSDNWFFSTELLTVAEWSGLRIRELPVKWTDSPDSRAKIASLTIQYLGAMKRLKALRPKS